MKMHWINFFVSSLVMSGCFVGCTSSVEKIANQNAPTLEQVYDQYTRGDPNKLADRKAELLRRPASEEALPLGSPLYPERLAHLYPPLPNPELFMYVRPHAVGVNGSPIPAYITRFRMYERQPYALPGESLESLNIQVNDQLTHSMLSAKKPARQPEQKSEKKRSNKRLKKNQQDDFFSVKN